MKEIICALIGHRYVVARHFSPSHRIVACKRCRQLWGMEDATQSFVPWDDELTSIFKELPHYDPKTNTYS